MITAQKRYAQERQAGEAFIALVEQLIADNPSLTRVAAFEAAKKHPHGRMYLREYCEAATLRVM